MDSAIQDEDLLWQRVFADSAGLFDNSLFFDPLVPPVGTLTPIPGQIPAPSPFNNTTSPTTAVVAQSAAAPPSPELDCVATSLPSPVFPPCPTETGAPAMSEQIESATTMPTIPTPLVKPGVPELSSAGGSTSSASEEPVSEGLQDGAAVQQRAGESCVRKRDRAKLLRQKMKDGYESLHKALVEISSSGANPSAAATTSLIPTRGSRRAAVVACSSELVRELTSACLALREENASLKERLAVSERERSSWVLVHGDDDDDDDDDGDGRSARSDVIGPTGVVRRKGSGGGNGRRERVGADKKAGIVFGQLLALGVFGFLGPRSLEEGRKVSREWRDKCAWDCCWSNLCVSRWRLCPEQRHAEVWRACKTEGGLGIVSPPAPPPSWRSVYGRLHKELHIPTGVFLKSAHLVVGKSVQQGVAIWVALCRRSNGMTGRSVRCPNSGVYKTQEVVQLRAVVQRVDEGPTVTVDPCGFSVRRQVATSLDSASSTATTAATTTTNTGIFPCLPPGDPLFSPRLTFNGGVAAVGSVGPASAFHLPRHKGGGGAAAVAAAAPFSATPLALYEYAAVDFFVKAAGCPTEVDFLRLEACVDIVVGGLQGGGRVLTVPLRQGREFVEAAVREIGARGATKRPSKRQGGFA